MAVQTWDTNIPAPSSDFNSEQADAAARTGELFGDKNARQRFIKSAAKIEVSFLLADTEKVAFETFYTTTCSNGAAWFTADWLAYFGFATHQARITERSLELLGVMVWKITATLEIRDVGAN